VGTATDPLTAGVGSPFGEPSGTTILGAEHRPNGSVVFNQELRGGSDASIV